MEKKGKIDGGGPGDYYGFMNSRLTKLEAIADTLQADVHAIKTDLAVIKSNYVTKENLQKAMTAATWKILSYVFGFNMVLVTSAYLLGKYVA